MTRPRPSEQIEQGREGWKQQQGEEQLGAVQIAASRVAVGAIRCSNGTESRAVTSGSISKMKVAVGRRGGEELQEQYKVQHLG